MFFLQSAKSDGQESSQSLSSAGEIELIPGHSIHDHFNALALDSGKKYYRVPELDPSTGYTAVVQRIGPDLRVIVCDSTGEKVSIAYVEPWQKKKADRVAKRLLKKARRDIFTTRDLYF